MKRIFLAVLLGFALGVTGCGGGGGDTADSGAADEVVEAPAKETPAAPAKETPAAPAKEAPAAPAKEAPAPVAEKTAPAAPADDGTVKIGILHSLSGTMAISETSLRDVVLMAAEEINAAGGVLGKKIVAEVVDPASNWPLFAEKAKELILEKKVAVTFGCWTLSLIHI